MSDDFNTAKVLANLFEMAPVINGIKGGQVATTALSADTISLMKTTFKTFLEDILGMQALQADKTRIRLRMDKKNTHLAELVQQHEALLALLARNGDARRRGVEPPPEQRIALPFILVQTDAGTHVEVAMTPDRQVVHLDFNQAQFQIYDDAHVLSNLQLVAPVLPVG